MKKPLLIISLSFFVAILAGCTYFMLNFNHIIDFDNERYTLKYSKILYRGNAILNEYTVGNEPVENWTKLISVNYFPNNTHDIAYLSNLHIESVKKSYGEQFKVLYDNRKGNVIVKSFIIVNRTYTEYNAIGYTKYKEGYYFLQFAKKYKYSNLNELKTESMKLLKENSKYTGLIESKITNFKPKPVFIDFEE